MTATAHSGSFGRFAKGFTTAVLVAAGLGVAGLVYHYAPLLTPEAEITVPLNPACDLAVTACTSPIPGGGQVTLSVVPRPIPVMEKIRMEVRTVGVRAGSVEVDFSGVDMNMGFNRYNLTAAGGGRFGGFGVLPVCTRERMEWEATVMIHTPGGLIAAPFRFATTRP